MKRDLIVLLSLLYTTSGTNGSIQAFAIDKRVSSSSLHTHFHPYKCDVACSTGMRVRGGTTNFLAAVPADIPPNTEKYHLVWSPNFWKKLLVSFGFWGVLVQIYNKSSWGLFKGSSTTDCHSPMGLVLPLLSSSCCAIQLIINAVSGLGCAGFNTYLGPLRPLFLSLFLILTWKQMHQRSPTWTVVSLFLAFLPECVNIWNEMTTKAFSQSVNAATNSSQSRSLPVNARVTLDIPAMGCVACVNKVDSSIRSSSFSTNIKQEKSWLKDGKGGVAELSIAAETNEEVNLVIEEVKRAVAEAGFKCEVVGMQIQRQ